MKVQHLPILALLAPLGVAQSPEFLEYRSLCTEDQTEGTKTFDNGVTSEYTCRIKATGQILREEVTNSAEECAAQCGKGCTGAVWQYTKKTCVLYDGPVSLSPHARGSVYLKPAHGAQDHGEESSSASECLHEKQACEDELGHQSEVSKGCQTELAALETENQECRERNDELDTGLKTCQREKDELDTKSKTCQRDKDDLDTKGKTCQREKDELDTKSKTCQREKDELDTKSKTCQREKDEGKANVADLERQLREKDEDLKACRNNSPSSGEVSSVSCPGHNGRTVTIRGRQFKITCGKYLAGGGWRFVQGPVSPKQCAERCVQVLNFCKTAVWHSNNGPQQRCVHYSRNSGPWDTRPATAASIDMRMI